MKERDTHFTGIIKILFLKNNFKVLTQNLLASNISKLVQ